MGCLTYYDLRILQIVEVVSLQSLSNFWYRKYLIFFISAVLLASIASQVDKIHIVIFHSELKCRCTFSAITKLLRVPRLGCYFLVILLSDVMTIHFFFLVQAPYSFPILKYYFAASHFLTIDTKKFNWFEDKYHVQVG